MANLKNAKQGEKDATNYSQSLSADLIASMPSMRRKQLLRDLNLNQLEVIQRDWNFWARQSQLPPKGKWRTWAFLGGRGAGKTRAASEWIVEKVEMGQAHSIALIGPTFQDVRDIMVEGHSGIINIAKDDFKPKFEPSNRRLIWPNGAKALLFSAEVPDSLRGPQFDLAWGDEFAAWPDGDEVMDVLLPALRLGENPQIMITTTPKPVPWVKKLFENNNCVITQSSTHENAANLSDGIIEEMENRWQNSIWARQELLGEMIDDPQGALWSRIDIKNARAKPAPSEFDKIIIAVDPPAMSGKNADACGIIVAGSIGNEAFVLADLTTQGLAPNEWAKVIADAYNQFEANLILAEANQGGEMVRTIISLSSPQAMVHLVHAKAAKRTRAEPVALLYSRGLIGHLAHFPALEDEMCRFGSKDFNHSPDRVDALVWAISHLLLNQGAPRARTLN